MYEGSEANALARLTIMLQPTVTPTLTNGELAILLTDSKRNDVDGLEPDDAGWTPTWNLRAAAADGWMLKAAKAAADYDVEAGSVKANRTGVYEMCMRMADKYRRAVGVGTIQAQRL